MIISFAESLFLILLFSQNTTPVPRLLDFLKADSNLFTVQAGTITKHQ